MGGERGSSKLGPNGLSRQAIRRHSPGSPCRRTLPAHRANMPSSRVFLLSPARCDGERAKLLFNPHATFELAVRLREADGAPLGEVFSFLSGLYFRGKLTYARAFATRPRKVAPVQVITTSRGLLTPDMPVTIGDLLEFASVDIGAANERYLSPFTRDVQELRRGLPRTAHVVLLGSIATGKYVDALVEAFGDRVVFPSEFVGRGDMSRGGLMLRKAREGVELDYIPLAGAVRKGKRPPKLQPMR